MKLERGETYGKYLTKKKESESEQTRVEFPRRWVEWICGRLQVVAIGTLTIELPLYMLTSPGMTSFSKVARRSLILNESSWGLGVGEEVDYEEVSQPIFGPGLQELALQKIVNDICY